MGNDSELSIIVRARNEASKVLKEVQNDASGLGKKVRTGFNDALPASRALALGVAGVGIAAGAAITKFGLLGGIDRALNIENAQAKLKGLGHDTNAIKDIMNSALKSVKGTAFGLDAAATAAASAVAAGVPSGKELTRVLSITGDTATITGRSFGEAGSIINKVLASNRLSMMEVNQLQDAGLPILSMLGKEYNKTAGEIRDMVSSGEIDSKRFLNAIEKNIGGAALASGDTTRGAFANMKAAMSRVGADIANEVMPTIRDSFLGLTQFFDAHSEQIVGAFKKMAQGFKSLADFISQNASTVIPVLAGAITVALIPALVTAAGAVWAFIAPLLPFLAIGAAVGFLASKLAEHFGGWGAVIEKIKPVIKEITGGFKAMVAAFRAGDGDITSSGFPGFMERVGNVARTVFDFIKKAAPLVLGILKEGFEQLLPPMQALWNALSTQLFPALMRLWEVLSPVLIPIIKVLAVLFAVQLYAAFIIAINVIKIIIGIVVWFIGVLSSVIRVVANVVQAIIGYVTLLWKFWSGVFKILATIVKVAFVIIATIIAVAISLILAVVQPIAKALSKPFRAAKDFIVNTWNTVGGFFSGVVSSISGALSGVYKTMTSPFQKAFDFIKGIPGKIVDAVGDIGALLRDKLGDWDIPGPLGKVRDVIPGFATGGFTGLGLTNQPAGIVHRGEFVVPKKDVDQSTGLPKNMGSNFNITVNLNSQVTTGDPAQMRQFSTEIAKNIARNLRAQGLSTSELGMLRT